MPKIRLTQSLISSYQWIFKKDSGYEEFLQALNREKKQPTQAMLDGQRFESVLNSVLNGEPIYMDNEWYDPLIEMAYELQGAAQQVVLFRDLRVDGEDFLIHGVLDYLREGLVWDCKYSKSYTLNHYLDSPQTSFYMYLVPEARQFRYIICDGKYVYRETYPRDIVQPIEPIVRNFINFVKQHDLYNILEEKWSVN